VLGFEVESLLPPDQPNYAHFNPDGNELGFVRNPQS